MHSSHNPSRPGWPAQLGELVLCIAAAVAIVAATDQGGAAGPQGGDAGSCVGCVTGPGAVSR